MPRAPARPRETLAPAVAAQHPSLRPQPLPTPPAAVPRRGLNDGRHERLELHDESIALGLREHLIAAGAGQPHPTPQINPGPTAHATDHNQHQGLDPSITTAGYPMSAGDAADGHLSEGGRKGRRELSTSKRAAQNRAAQRAFRQRKEEYIKSLKDQVKDYEQMADQFRAIQSENNTLRDYVISLQARLLESQGSYPEPPGNIDLSRPHTEIPPPVQAMQSPQPPNSSGTSQHSQQQQQPQQQHQPQQHQQQHQQQPAPTAPMSASAAQQLQQAAAQAAAAQASTEHLNNGAKHSHEEAQYLPASNEYPPQKRMKSEDAAANSGRQSSFA
ncbi:bzip transcription factor [Diplodia corticola]|uniref:Putative transcription factor kapC n=1 Tax=Diplodia corticola TaxID=236234 RepID=A0A1J9RIG1_9PEZI|nr:bzip transcription factor [Diplodia corticola]OJD40241.1 bzip transcription factor [Diplodia corticola]